jgi:uncharacterized membrane protein
MLGAAATFLERSNVARPDPRRGQAIAALATGAAAVMGVIAAYQTGLIRHLPDPPISGFDSEKVTGSPQAYRLGGIPDGLLGLANYAATAALAVAGGRGEAERRPWRAVALAGKVGLDAAVAAKLTYDEKTKQKAWCSWCLGATLMTAAMVPLVIPEAWRAVRHLLGRGR